MPATIRRGSRFAGYSPLSFRGNFGGFNTHDAPDNIAQGGGRSAVVQTPDSLNMFSEPFGAITSFPGHANINGSAANGGEEITGIAFLGEIAQKLGLVAGAQFLEDVAGTPTDRTGGLTITNDPNNLIDHGFLNSLAIFTDRSGDAPWKWSGSGNIAALGGSPPSSPLYVVAPYDRRCWLFTAQQGFYSAKDNPESYDTTDDVLNFYTNDDTVITSATRVGDSIYVGKSGPNSGIGHVFRVSRSGDPSVPYSFERIETGGIGPISQQATKAIGQDYMFPALDGNVYLIRGNVFFPNGIGRNIRKTLLTDFNKTRFQYATAAVLRQKGLVGFAFTQSGGTTHDRVFWYDYVNSVPGRADTHREFWYLTSHAFNAATERTNAGAIELVTGGFDGFYERHPVGDNYAGQAYNKFRLTPWHLVGDPMQAYHILGLILEVDVKGANFNITANYRTDFDLNWSSDITLTPVGGTGLGSFILGTSTLGGPAQDTLGTIINAVAKRIQFRFQNQNADEPITVFSYHLIVKPLYRIFSF